MNTAFRLSRALPGRNQVYRSFPIFTRPHFRKFPQSRSYTPQYKYNRFDGGGQKSGSNILGSLFRRWAARPTFYYEIAGIGGVGTTIYVYNLETVPISGRRRFNIYSAESERQLGEQTYNDLLQEMKGSILPEDHPSVLQVKRVLGRLVEGLAKLENEGHLTEGGDAAAVSARGWSNGLDDWVVHVIASDQVNAFVIPGNKVFVFTGILPICQDDSGIASVLGHEIAHNVAHHMAEKLSSSMISRSIWFLAQIALSIAGLQLPVDVTGTIINLVLEMPHSRRQESEADLIGLLLMAQSCYDPRSALKFWQRMRSASKTNVPQLLSTHPSDETRITQLIAWMPRAYEKYEDSDCVNTAQKAKEFFSPGLVWG